VFLSFCGLSEDADVEKLPFLVRIYAVNDSVEYASFLSIEILLSLLNILFFY